MIFLDPFERLLPDEELARYKEHQNSSDDQNYRKFLSPLVDELIPKLDPGSQGLDFGSGPGPAVPAMFTEKGFTMTTFDPFFSNFKERLQKCYDFVTCTETAEHWFKPQAELTLINTLLKRNSWLGMMTCLFDDQDQFKNSHYHRDPTHVCFYSSKTCHWVAKLFSWKIYFPRKNVVLFQKI
ncbi:MAG: methyltransferase domain-containing protein [Bdellovibrionales bacterium]|nr:methyltransferase domain-containing protein [Bdellovibrionales bacterium]